MPELKFEVEQAMDTYRAIHDMLECHMTHFSSDEIPLHHQKCRIARESTLYKETVQTLRSYFHGEMS